MLLINLESTAPCNEVQIQVKGWSSKSSSWWGLTSLVTIDLSPSYHSNNVKYRKYKKGVFNYVLINFSNPFVDTVWREYSRDGYVYLNNYLEVVLSDHALHRQL